MWLYKIADAKDWLLQRGIMQQFVDYAIDNDRIPKKMQKWLAVQLDKEFKNHFALTNHPDMTPELFLSSKQDEIIEIADMFAWKLLHREPLSKQDINQYSFFDAYAESVAWQESMAGQRGQGHPKYYTQHNGEVLGNGFRMVKVPLEDLKNEGALMQHCVGDGNYDDGVQQGSTVIFSLRDKNGWPHATIEVTNRGWHGGPVIEADDDEDYYYDGGYAYSNQDWHVQQIQGKQNKTPVSEYKPYINNWLKKHPEYSISNEIRVEIMDDKELVDLIFENKTDYVLFTIVFPKLPTDIKFKIADELITKDKGVGWIDINIRKCLYYLSGEDFSLVFPLIQQVMEGEFADMIRLAASQYLTGLPWRRNVQDKTVREWVINFIRQEEVPEIAASALGLLTKTSVSPDGFVFSTKFSKDILPLVIETSRRFRDSMFSTRRDVDKMCLNALSDVTPEIAAELVNIALESGLEYEVRRSLSDVPTGHFAQIWGRLPIDARNGLLKNDNTMCVPFANLLTKHKSITEQQIDPSNIQEMQEPDVEPNIQQTDQHMAITKNWLIKIADAREWLARQGMIKEFIDYAIDNDRIPKKIQKWVVIQLDKEFKREVEFEEEQKKEPNGITRILEPMSFISDKREEIGEIADMCDWKIRHREPLKKKDINTYSIEEAYAESREWQKEMETRRGEGHPDFYKYPRGRYNNPEQLFKDGYYIVEVDDLGDLDNEGAIMQHCVGDGHYDKPVLDGETRIFSLRDPKGWPHVTIEVQDVNADARKEELSDMEAWELNPDNQVFDEAGNLVDFDTDDFYDDPDRPDTDPKWSVAQIQGKQDQPPINKYRGYIRDWLATQDFEIDEDLELTITDENEILQDIFQNKDDAKHTRERIAHLSEESYKQLFDAVLQNPNEWNSDTVTSVLSKVGEKLEWTIDKLMPILAPFLDPEQWSDSVRQAAARALSIPLMGIYKQHPEYRQWVINQIQNERWSPAVAKTFLNTLHEHEYLPEDVNGTGPIISRYPEDVLPLALEVSDRFAKFEPLVARKDLDSEIFANVALDVDPDVAVNLLNRCMKSHAPITTYVIRDTLGKLPTSHFWEIWKRLDLRHQEQLANEDKLHQPSYDHISPSYDHFRPHASALDWWNNYRKQFYEYQTRFNDRRNLELRGQRPPGAEPVKPKYPEYNPDWATVAPTGYERLSLPRGGKYYSPGRNTVAAVQPTEIGVDENLIRMLQIHSGGGKVHDIQSAIAAYCLAIETYNQTGDPKWMGIIERRERQMRQFLYERGVTANRNWLTKIAQKWWDMSQADFMEHHRTGYIPSSAYEKHNIEWLNTWHPGKEKYPVLLTTMNIDGYEVEFRQTGERTKYVKLLPPEEDGWEEIARDERGLALYLSDEEMLERGYPLEEQEISMFVGDQCIGWIGTSFGATELFVMEEYQGHGIGTAALKLWLQKYPSHGKKPRRLGQMTNAGENTARRVHKELVQEALAKGENVPPEILQDYPELQNPKGL